VLFERAPAGQPMCQAITSVWCHTERSPKEGDIANAVESCRGPAMERGVCIAAFLHRQSLMFALRIDVQSLNCACQFHWSHSVPRGVTRRKCLNFARPLHCASFMVLTMKSMFSGSIVFTVR